MYKPFHTTPDHVAHYHVCFLSCRGESETIMELEENQLNSSESALVLMDWYT